MSRRVRSLSRPFPWTEADPEKRNALFLYLGIGVVLIFAFILIAVGYYQDRVAPKHATVLSVGGRNFSLEYLQRRLMVEVNRGVVSGQTSVADAVRQVAASIEAEELARQAGRQAGITVSEADYRAFLAQQLALPADVSREVFAVRYRQELLRKVPNCDTPCLSEAEYRDTVLARFYESRLREQITARMPTTAVPQANIRLIQLRDRAAAESIQKQLAADDTEFAAVALRSSVHQTKETGGQYGWATRDELPPKVGEAAFSLPVDTLSPVIEEPDGYYIVQVSVRDERPIEVVQKTLIANQQFRNLLAETREKVGSTNRITEEQVRRIIRALAGVPQARG